MAREGSWPLIECLPASRFGVSPDHFTLLGFLGRSCPFHQVTNPARLSCWSKMTLRRQLGSEHSFRASNRHKYSGTTGWSDRSRP